MFYKQAAQKKARASHIKSDKGVMGWKNNEQSYKIIVQAHTYTLYIMTEKSGGKKNSSSNKW